MNALLEAYKMVQRIRAVTLRGDAETFERWAPRLSTWEAHHYYLLQRAIAHRSLLRAERHYGR